MEHSYTTEAFNDHAAVTTLILNCDPIQPKVAHPFSEKRWHGGHLYILIISIFSRSSKILIRWKPSGLSHGWYNNLILFFSLVLITEFVFLFFSPFGMANLHVCTFYLFIYLYIFANADRTPRIGKTTSRNSATVLTTNVHLSEVLGIQDATPYCPLQYNIDNCKSYFPFEENSSKRCCFYIYSSVILHHHHG